MISVFLESYRDAGIITICGIIILLNRMVNPSHHPDFPWNLHKRSGKASEVG
jgi:hypothetical protein